MALRLRNLPDDIESWPEWLEKEVAGPHLTDLVHELRLLNGVEGTASQFVSFDDLLGSELDSILQSGLSTVPADKLKALIDHPVLLIELRERVLLSDSEYWFDRCQAAHEADDSVWDEPVNVSASETGDGNDAKLGKEDLSSVRPADPRWTVGRTSFVLSLAAVILAAVSIWMYRPQPVPVAEWGFQSESAYQADSSPDYFSSLASAANEWFDVRPADSAALATRLREFSTGCELLIEREHPTLTDLEWQWLVSEVESWKDQIDDLSSRLAEDSDRFESVRDQADETIRTIVESLEKRAENVS